MKIEPARELWLVRHAESEGNRGKRFTGHGPSPLSEKGRRQADALAEAFGALTFEAVYASDLPRAMQTAAPLAQRLGYTIRPWASLRERDMGDLVDLSFDEVKARYPEGWSALLRRDPDWAPPNGESHAQCAARVSRAIDEVLSQHARGRVLVVSHGVAINHMLRYLMAVTEPAVLFTVDNASVQRVEWHDGGLRRVACINDTAHLSGVT
ncbi:MAG: histidine phosphatase family protein [Polyangiales bacterium]